MSSNHRISKVTSSDALIRPFSIVITIQLSSSRIPSYHFFGQSANAHRSRQSTCLPRIPRRVPGQYFTGRVWRFHRAGDPVRLTPLLCPIPYNSSFGWDDAIVPIARLTNVGLATLFVSGFCWSSKYATMTNYITTAPLDNAGVGRHITAVLNAHPQELVAWAKSLYALEWLYLTSVALPKMSILFFYLRILTSRQARLMCYALACAVGAIWVSYTIAFNLQSIPLAYQWDKPIPGGHCFHVDEYFKATSIPNIVTDMMSEEGSS